MPPFRRCGSSPHTRGARRQGASPGPSGRIIPAYAGSTFRIRTMARCRTDHPRIRGEHHLLMAPTRFWQGSSPHTRGARGARRPGAFDCGIIPAYAGSTRVRDGGLMAAEDHPRIRGEHTASHGLRGASGGSSPHTRGARPRRTATFSRRRIIPAYAGSTRPVRSQRSRCRDHPRIRGEHPRNAIVCPSREGSSPHTRGARRWTRHDHRIIPAYAGSTPSGTTLGGISRDHPRIRGEHAWPARASAVRVGSSPHTRGALTQRAFVDPLLRIIPAYAGST